MASRRIEDLTPAMQARAREVLWLAEKRGMELLIYCTWRSPEEQARLFRQGRGLAEIEGAAERLGTIWGRADLGQLLLDVGPQAGDRVVTNAGPGQSAHQYREAWDAVPLVGGKAMWDPAHESWEQYGEIVMEAGLQWAGTWVAFREYPHAQIINFNWRTRIQAADFGALAA